MIPAAVVALFELALDCLIVWGTDTSKWSRPMLAQWLRVMKTIAASGYRVK